MNKTEEVVASPLHPSSDVRNGSQGSEYPLSTVVRRLRNTVTGEFNGPLTHEGIHYGTGKRTGLIRFDRNLAIDDIRRCT